MSSLKAETASWEESQLQLIAQNPELLHNFQVLKYINGGHFSRIMAKHRETQLLLAAGSGTFGQLFNLFLVQLKLLLLIIE